MFPLSRRSGGRFKCTNFVRLTCSVASMLSQHRVIAASENFYCSMKMGPHSAIEISGNYVPFGTVLLKPKNHLANVGDTNDPMR